MIDRVVGLKNMVRVGVNQPCGGRRAEVAASEMEDMEGTE